MGKSGLKDSASATKAADNAKKSAKGTVTESRTFRDGVIYLYKRADFKKPTWLCRVKVPNGSGYVNRSTGTGDEHQAFKFADDLYNQLLVKSLKREVVARSSDIKTYFKRIHDLRVEELTVEGKPKPKIDPNSLVFCHKDGSEIGTFKKSFMALMKKAGVERDSHGDLRSLYSLRHTYATFCLQHGVSVYTLAKNMGTSVAMIEQYYGHTTNIASAAELTKKVKKQASGAASSLSWLESD